MNQVKDDAFNLSFDLACAERSRSSKDNPSCGYSFVGTFIDKDNTSGITVIPA